MRAYDEFVIAVNLWSVVDGYDTKGDIQDMMVVCVIPLW